MNRERVSRAAMDMKLVWVGLLAVGIGAAALAGLRSSTPPEPPRPEPAPSMGGAGAGGALPPGHPPISPSTQSPAMPPGHPPVGTGAAQPPAPGGPVAAIQWTVPSRWKEAPNPSSMRLATYKIPKTGSDTQDAEMSVSQAGGGTTANLDRWVGQFDEAGQKTVKKSERTVSGFKTTIIELEGTFAAGSMMGGPATPQAGWALIGAIVETPGAAHFFKLTGPAGTVKSARGDVDALLSSIKPK